jgi:outer membrane receptor protein involved in Fe transport
MINLGSSFSRVFADSLENTGTGVNYGLELTVQKYFDKNFFFLFSGTLYNSEYKGSDGVTRNTSYNGKYVANLLAGKEFKLGKNNVIGLGVKVTRAGGKKYGYVDVAATNQNYDLTFLDSAFNTRQFRDYFRLDLKISWRLNTAKMTHEIGLDLVNLLGTRNILGLTYAPSLDPAESSDPGYQPTAEKTQLGFLPIFYYKIDFRRAK